MERVAVTAAEVGPRFPLYADPADGRWTTTGRGSWTGGFWAGLLWLRARYTGAEPDRRAAAACTARLEPWAGADTATRGLIFWYGTAAAGDDAEAAALRARAARACLSACDPELGILPWGDALGGPRLLARVDAVPGTVPLLAGAGPGGGGAGGGPPRPPRPAGGGGCGAGWLSRRAAGGGGGGAAPSTP
ncbi:sugar ABC transporter permease, partial [Streptomyces erythrochromogenes]